MCMSIRIVFIVIALVVSASPRAEVVDLQAVQDQASRLDRLHSLLVLHHGEPVLEYARAGPGLSQPANIKSLSKTVLSVLAGIAIDRGEFSSLDQSILELLDAPSENGADPRLASITVGQALSMQAGLQSTSGRNYGRWVQSNDWVAHVLSRPFVAEPGEGMIYSTGSTHLVSAALVEATGRSTLELARDWLGEPLGITIPDWLKDPQGIHFGGNDMALSPRALARIGELYRLEGELDGQRVVSADWVRRSWQPTGASRWTGDGYGYGWFITQLAGKRAYYGRGFGGQALFVVPDAALTVVITSNPNPPSAGGRHFANLKRLAEMAVRAVD